MGGPCVVRLGPGLGHQAAEVAAQDLLDARLGVAARRQQVGQALELRRAAQVGQEGGDVGRLARRADAQGAALRDLVLQLAAVGRHVVVGVVPPSVPRPT